MSSIFDGVTFASLGYGLDIAPQIIDFREGWHDLEWSDGRHFRWIGDEAHALLASSGLGYSLRVDVEAGPGIEADSFVLEAYVDGALRESKTILGRSMFRFSVAPSEAGIRSIVLKVRGGGLSAPNDPRILNARVFAFVALPVPVEVVPVWDAVQIGRGWYSLQDSGSDTFRTIGRAAHILVRNAMPTLELELEPVPGFAERSVRLDVDVADHWAYRSYLIEGRTRIRIDLTEFDAFPIRVVLRCERHKPPILPDARVHNIRVFQSRVPWDRIELLRRLAGRITYTEPLSG